MAKILAFRALEKYEHPANCFDINHNACLADIGSLVSEAICYSDDSNHDAVRDMLFDIHSMIYPNASRTKPS